jgi:hypothetical protein
MNSNNKHYAMHRELIRLTPNIIRKWSWIVFIILGTSSFSLSRGEMTFESFKEFLSNPPVIESMIFSRELVSPVYAFPNMKEAKRAMKEIESGKRMPAEPRELYFLRYQSDPSGHVFRAIRTTEEAGDPHSPRMPVFHGHFESDWWWVQPGNLSIMEYDGGISAPSMNICINSIRQATEILRFGMFELLPESIFWDGTNFTGSVEFGGTASGNVILTQTGGIAGLLYSLPSGETKELQFIYEENFPIKFPSGIIVNRQPVKSSISQAYCSFETKQISIAEKAMLREAFSPEIYVTAKDVVTELHMDGRAYVLQGTNRMQIRTGSAGGAGAGWRVLVKSCAGLAVLLAIALSFRAWQASKQTK